MFANIGQRRSGEVFGKIHAYLPSLHNMPFAGFGFKQVNWHFKMVAHKFLNMLNG
jgi:hypothetical protein